MSSPDFGARGRALYARRRSLPDAIWPTTAHAASSATTHHHRRSLRCPRGRDRKTRFAFSSEQSSRADGSIRVFHTSRNSTSSRKCFLQPEHRVRLYPVDPRDEDKKLPEDSATVNNKVRTAVKESVDHRLDCNPATVASSFSQRGGTEGGQEEGIRFEYWKLLEIYM